MRILGNLLLVLGTCLAAVGAAGFADTPESGAWPFFLGGLALCLAGAQFSRLAGKDAAGPAHHPIAVVGSLRKRLRTIVESVAFLDQTRDEIGSEEFCSRVDDLLRGAFFEMGLRVDEYQRLLGFSDYSRVWEGVAIGERLLARSWSMATDGHFAEALEEIPLAKEALARALGRLESLELG